MKSAWTTATLLMALAAPLHAGEPARCLLSFDSATLDVCTGQLATEHDHLVALADIATFAQSPFRVVKFDGPLGARQRETLLALGARILGYVPHHAWLVHMPAALDERAQEMAGVVWTGPYLPLWKIDGNLARSLGGSDLIVRAGIDRLTLSLHPGVDPAQQRHALAAVAGIEIITTSGDGDQPRLTARFQREHLATAVDALARRPEIAAINLAWPAGYDNSQGIWLHQSGTPDHLPVFEQGLFGCGQVIGGLDSGLHATHCSFADPEFGPPVTTVCDAGADCPVQTPDFAHRKVGIHYNWDGSDHTVPFDGYGHGTHVFGTLAGNNLADPVDCAALTSPGGLTDLDGIAPGAKLVTQQAGVYLEYINELGGTLYHAATTAYANGASIHNNSWSSGCRDQFGNCVEGCQVEYRPASQDADRAVWEFPELAVFVSAGNSGGLGGNAGCGPGADVGAAGNAKNAFSIGSNNRGEDGNNLSTFSSRGPTQDRRSKPDLTAQGRRVVSAQIDACGIRYESGTSMAAPTAGGNATLVRDYLARGFHPDGMAAPANAIATPSSALIKAIMVTGAQSLSGTGSTGGAPSQSQGWGRVNLDNALYFAGDDHRLWLHDNRHGLATGAVDFHRLAVAAGEPLRVTLVWHDHPALLNANPHGVNRLRLELETPDGEVWTQKLSPLGGLEQPNPHQGTGALDFDEVNNVHRLELLAPAGGEYRLRVVGVQTAMGERQPYALAATGNIADIGAPDFLLGASPGSAAICAGQPAEYAIAASALGGFNDPVSLSVAGVPAPATHSLSPAGVTPADPPAISQLVIDNTATIEPGRHLLTVSGTASGPTHPELTRSIEVSLNVADAAPDLPVPTAPADQASHVSLTPTLVWQAVAQADHYQVQLARDPEFTDIVFDRQTTNTEATVTTPLLTNTVFHWRVRALNACGDGDWSPVRSFRTLLGPADCPDPTTAPQVVFNEPFATSLGGFVTEGSIGISTWRRSTARPSPGSGGGAALAINMEVVTDQRLTSPAITLPDDASPLTLQFHNYQVIEDDSGNACYDGGIVEISADDGQTWSQVPADALLTQPYTGPVANGFGNPLAGRLAWCGDPRPWRRNVIDIDAWAGQTVRLRWRLGTDSSAGRSPHGWYVDDILVQSCRQPVLPVDPIFCAGFETDDDGGCAKQ